MAVSKKRLSANRQNSLKAQEKCTGPKDCSSTKYNALRHGMTARQPVFLSNEEGEEYKKLRENIRSMLPTKSGGEDLLAKKIAFCLWRLQRGRNFETEIICSFAKLDGIDWQGLLKSGYLGKISRYEHRIMNYLDKLLKELLQQTRKLTITEDHAFPILNLNQAIFPILR